MQTLHSLPPASNQEGLLHRIANRIRQSLELQEILDAMVIEVQGYLSIDRVKVYRFHPDSSGLVIAESVDSDRLPSLLDLNFPAEDIPPYARELFLRARQRSVVDVSGAQIGLSLLDDPDTGEPSESKDIRYRPLDPCHKEYLSAMGVQSSIVVPIVLTDLSPADHCSESSATSAQLWGLLACHHSQTRQVTEEELQFIQAVVDQVSVAIAQSILLKQVRIQAQQEANINQVTRLLHVSPVVKLQEALEKAIETLEGSGGRLYLIEADALPREIYTYGEQPADIDLEQRTVEENYLWKNFIHSMVVTSESDQTGHKPWSVQWMRSIYKLGDEESAPFKHPQIWPIKDLYREPLFRTLAPFFQSTSARGLLVVPLYYGSQVMGCLTIFREAIDTEVKWAGWHNPDSRQLMARQSFEVWQEAQKDQSPVWTDSEISYAKALGERFSTAIQQYRLHQQVQALNTTLEQQVEERTGQLQLANLKLESLISRQQILANMVAKIRESLDIEEIFRITIEELSQILEADKVSIYRFNEDWGGEFVADFNGVNLQLTEGCALGARTVWNDTHLQNSQGGRYRNGDSFVVNDVTQQGFSQCHLDVYHQYQIKAFINIPIFVGKGLWGILAVFQQQTTRQWKPTEVEFVSQLAAQIGVALQHASLANSEREKNDQLSTALSELQATQTQLVQTEKMSSLGQLVAGIAHEINNPVNFIHANVNHLKEYSTRLLEVISGYQKHYPDPPAELQELMEVAEIEYLTDDFPKLYKSISTGTKRIRSIVLSLRNFSRLDEAETKAVDLHEGIESTLLILQHRLNAGPSQVSIEIVKQYGDLPKVECHARQINQVFMNLLSNALDELQSIVPSDEVEETKAIRIVTRRLCEDWVQVSISDDGMGIAPSILDKLFDPFFTTKSVGKGTGLGLSISYKIIEKHKGKLYCESTVGEGATFVVELPIKEECKTGDAGSSRFPLG